MCCHDNKFSRLPASMSMGSAGRELSNSACEPQCDWSHLCCLCVDQGMLGRTQSECSVLSQSSGEVMLLNLLGLWTGSMKGCSLDEYPPPCTLHASRWICAVVCGNWRGAV